MAENGPLPETRRVYGQGNNGVGNNFNLNAFGPRLAENDTLYDNARDFLRTGFGQRHNLAFDGGTDRYTYRLSAGYTNLQGANPTTAYKRLNLTLGGTAKITDKLALESTIQYINTDNIKVSKGVNSFLLGMLSWPVTDDLSNYLNLDGSRRRATAAISEIENPYLDVNRNQLRNRGNRVVTNIGATYTVTDWLTLSARVGLDASKNASFVFRLPGTTVNIDTIAFNNTVNDRVLTIFTRGLLARPVQQRRVSTFTSTGKPYAHCSTPRPVIYRSGNFCFLLWGWYQQKAHNLR